MLSNREIHGLILQPRDFLFIRGLFESRIMSMQQASEVYFDAHFEYARKRIRQLKNASLITLRTERWKNSGVIALSKRGLIVLRDFDGLIGYPTLSSEIMRKRLTVSSHNIQHELMCMDVKAAFVSSFRSSTIYRVNEFTTWPLLCQVRLGQTSHVQELIKPDGFIEIGERRSGGNDSIHYFFLEVDASTETLATVAQKISNYAAYYRSGGFAERFGNSESELRRVPFRVLIVCASAERRNNICEKIMTFPTPVLCQAWLTTIAEVSDNPFGPIWVRPMDFADATAGSSFDPRRRHSWATYRSNKKREVFVEQKVVKHVLVESQNSYTDKFVDMSQ